jgi:regulation of enolase protein 1 (concanavalin A-like superfamily)
VGSFGTGRATIYGGDGTGIFVYNTSGFRIEHLYVVGSGRDINTGHGIFFFNDLPGDVKLDYIRIDSVDTVRFGNYGVLIGGYIGASGFRNVRMTAVNAAENKLGGIFTYAAQPNVHENVYVGYSSAHLNSGMAGLLYNSGNGITLSGVNGGTIEHSVARQNGWLSDAGNGPIGIWAFDSTRILIQFNESHHNMTGRTKDGGGFCFDQNTSHSIMQFNYSHDNAGAGYLLAHKPDNYAHTNNIIRYNISENDARANAYAALHTWGRIRNAHFHNNTVYLADRGSITEVPRGIYVKNQSITLQDPESVHFRNNLIQTTGGVRLVEIQATALDAAIDLRFEGNAYYTTGGAFNIYWGGVWYGSLEAWRAGTGQEQRNGIATGMVVDPRHVAPGLGMTFNNTSMLRGLYGYRLRADSPLIDAGLDLRAMGIETGTRDYYGGALPYNAGRMDIGAHEYGGECHWSISPRTATAPAEGTLTGSTVVSITNAPCGWAAQSSVDWMHVWDGVSGDAGGTATFWVLQNDTGSSRTATIRIADQLFTLSQPPVASPPPNAAPAVAVTSPPDGASFTAPATITLAASASDTDGTVSKVEFYTGTSLLASDTASPYEFTWRNVPAGAYTVTAKATDDDGAVTTSAAVTITVNASTALPAPWTSQDIGPVGIAGSATASGGTVTVKASGADIWGSADQLHYVWQRVSGDVDIVARVASVEYLHAWTKAGVMIRQTAAADSPQGLMLVSPARGLAFQRRLVAGGLSTSTSGGTGTAPAWVKLERRGQVITAFRSSDGLTWTVVGSDTFTMGPDVYVGLALTSHDNTRLAAASFDNVAATASAPEPPPPNAAPAVAVTSPPDGASFTAPATITLAASASDADGTVTKVEFYAGTSLLGTDTASPYELTWQNVAAGTYTVTAKATDDDGAVTTSAAVTIIVIASTALPAPWTSQDIGAVGIAGSATATSGTVTVKASGADIWGAADQLHYVWQRVSGDVDIVARVASVEYAHAWTKAGVMIRQTLAADSPQGLMLVSPAKGLAFQRRLVASGLSTSTGGGTGTAPAWVKLERRGDAITAYRSSDGITWTVVGSDTFTVGPDVYVGLAATSHDNARLAAATFDSVSVTKR